MDYAITNSLPVNGKTVKVVEIFDPATGATISTTRRLRGESESSWIARAFEGAEFAISRI